VKYLRNEGRIITTAGIARRGRSYFLARRSSGGSQDGKWEFPGGKCEGRESIPRCLEREFLEEFDLTVIPGDEIGSVQFSHDGEDFVLLGVELTFQGEPATLHEHSEYGWFTPEEAFKLDLTESDRRLLSHIVDAT